MITQPQLLAILQKHLDCYELNKELYLDDYLDDLNDAIEEAKLSFFIGTRTEDRETSLYAFFNKSKQSEPNKLHTIEIIFNHEVNIDGYTVVEIANTLLELEEQANQINQLFFPKFIFNPTPMGKNGLVKLEPNN